MNMTRSDDGYAVSGEINGHYYVDLGLSVKWADRNIGALSSRAYGADFAWGEAESKHLYTYTVPNSYTRQVGMGDIAGNAEHDAATANWGSKWRMPTVDEFEELLEQCSWVWTHRKGLYGYLVTGPNGNSIFLPAAGERDGTSLHQVGSGGYYWSSTTGSRIAGNAYYLYFNSNRLSLNYGHCGCLRRVRPVTE